SLSCSCVLSFYDTCFFFTLRPPPSPTLFPYTTLFRSDERPLGQGAVMLSRDGWQLVMAALEGDEASRDAAFDVLQRRAPPAWLRSEEHTSELQSRFDLVCRLLLEKKKNRLVHSHT